MSLAYRPEIDGLRAIAVTAVILFHGGVVPVPGGFAGVDVFFVLSGYLITAILLRDLETGRHSLRGFYERRVRRIVPALVVVLLATTAAAWAVMIPTQLYAYSRSLLAVLLFVSNFLFGANTGYFSPALEEAPLLHTWSLAVEEQFYLVFPLLLAACVRRGPRRAFFVLLGVGVASLLLGEVGARLRPEANFFFTLSRFWELLAGALAAFLQRSRPIPNHGPGAAVGLGAILVSLFLHGEDTAYPSFATLLPVGGAVLVLLHAGPATTVGRWLASRPLVGVGLVSYSAYLWHQPLFALARVVSLDAPSAASLLVLTALAYGLAAVSWALVEQPFRRAEGRWLPEGRALFRAAGASTLGLLVLAGVGMATRGNDRGWRARHPDQAVVLDLILTARREAGLPDDEGGCRFNRTEIDEPARRRIRECARQHGPAAVVLGDSHGIDVFQAIRQVGQTPFLLGVTNGGCRPADNDPDCPFFAFRDLAIREPQLFGEVLFVQAGAYLLRGPDGREGSRQLFARASAWAPLPDFAVNQEALEEIVSYLTPIRTAGIPVLWMGSRIEPHVSPNRVLRRGCEAEYPLRPGQREAFERIDAAIAIRAAAAGLRHLPMAALEFDMERDFLTCEALFWSDGDHWSTAGEARFGARLWPHLPPLFRGNAPGS